MKTLVFGGRDYWNRELVYKTLDAIHKATPISLIIHGGAKGADLIAKDWAKLRGIPDRPFEADWDDLQAEQVVPRRRPDGSFYNAAAGGIRNKRMLMEGKPDTAIGFPGGKGTKDMTQRVQREQRYRKLRYVRVDADGMRNER